MGIFRRKKTGRGEEGRATVAPGAVHVPRVTTDERFRPVLSAVLPDGWWGKESITLLASDGAANVIASSEPLSPGIISAAYAAAQGDLLRQEFPGYRERSFEPKHVFGGPGYIRCFDWQPPDGDAVTQIQAYFASDGRGYTATATTPAAGFERREAQLREVIESVSISTGPVPGHGANAPSLLDPESTRGQVQRLLTNLVDTVQVDRDGLMSFPYGSTRVFAKVMPFHESSTVNVYAITNVGIPPSPDLFHHAALMADRWMFGHLGVQETPQGVDLVFRRSIPADFLNAEQLRHAVACVAIAADQVDDEIATKFGGKRFRELEESVSSAAATKVIGARSSGRSDEDVTESDVPGYL